MAAIMEVDKTVNNKLNQEVVDNIRRLVNEGRSYRGVSKQLGISLTAVARYAKKLDDVKKPMSNSDSLAAHQRWENHRTKAEKHQDEVDKMTLLGGTKKLLNLDKMPLKSQSNQRENYKMKTERHQDVDKRKFLDLNKLPTTQNHMVERYQDVNGSRNEQLQEIIHRIYGIEWDNEDLPDVWNVMKSIDKLAMRSKR
jgi:predicted transcriptional regulator